MDADGSAEQKIFTNGSAAYVCGDAAIGVIVFNSSGNPTGENPQGDFEIFTSDMSGGNVRQLTHNAVLDSGPKWSPDCSQISFNQLDAGGSLDVMRMGADGGDVVNLSNAPGTFDAFSAWSPDGQEIVFSTDRDGNFEIYSLSSIDGSNLRRLTSNRRSESDLRSDWGTLPDYDGPPTHKDQCKRDGWTEFSSPSFSDQDACVGYVQRSAGVSAP